MLFTDPYPRVVAVQSGTYKRRNPLRLLILGLVIVASLAHALHVLRPNPERKAPAHVVHAHTHAARFVRP